ncbi:phosphoadenosine phosphosulfate reductase family protein (plasmid) [Trichlorobacter lovleyi]|uniref:phosphoadenosine phosphosulfate reductase domain-containing protein n=1 Tax=Trichlorobacter lovleyi TaxID=313985 RepID=UPI00223E9E14|nr:phosphoadenosine phosphosulfate reductase family protein [Trichlorobacter lovleyi]QOX80846.1 phosphoadenosine phosphosulfate reductase family protein [Trichlorobacter lovleyi]
MDTAKIEKAKQIIKDVAEKGHPLFTSTSWGKDSTATLNLVLTSLKELKEQGLEVPPLFITTADTLLENPEMASHVQREMQSAQSYIAKHDLNARIEVSTPNLLSQWAVKTISGRNLPVFANKGTRDCTVDMKCKPLESLKNKLMKELAKETALKPVTCIGTRYLESSGREKRMIDRGEIPDGIWVDPESKGLMLSPIADWTDSDLWQYLYACSRGETESYGDLSSLIDIYWAGTSEAASCDGIEMPNCRYGCAICCVGRDRSLEAMLAKGERYAYMQSLYDLQRFLINTQHDLSLRQWVGRSITDGYLAIGPDVYSPEMLENLLRYCLTIDVQEMESAYNAGIAPRFQLISPEALIAIDALWSQQGVHRSFHALEIYRDIYVNGKRYQIPVTAPGKPVKIPEARYIEVGKGWEDRGGKYEYCGMRDIHLEMVNEQGDGGCLEHKKLKDGRVVLDAESSKEAFEINQESIEFILGFELDYLIELGYRMPRSYGYKHYITLGAFKLNSSQFLSTDDILRRTTFKEFEGIFEMPVEELMELTISAEDMRLAVADSLRPGCVGDSHQPGARVLTASNRATKPYPKKPQDVARWLIDCAYTEARLRKDKIAKETFRKAKRDYLPADAEIAEYYLFTRAEDPQQGQQQSAKIIPIHDKILDIIPEQHNIPANWIQLDLLAA